MRVLILGGTGFLGRHVASALRRADGLEVAVASRSGRHGSLQIDLDDYSSRTGLEGFDVVVNCSDSTRVSPVRAAEYCLLCGSCFVETSADPAVVRELEEFASGVEGATGSVVLCAGLFPGLTNLLAAELYRDYPDITRLEVGVRYSPWSQAGSGVCRLMAHAVGAPALRFERGQPVEDPPMGVGGILPFWKGESSALSVGLPESWMLHRSTGVESTGSAIAPVPGIPVALQRVLTLFAPWSVLRWSPVRAGLHLGFRLLRGVLFRWRGAGFELAAVGDRHLRGDYRAASCLRVDDGFVAAGFATAAMVVELARALPEPGVSWVDRRLRLDPVVDRMRELAGEDLRVDVRR